MSEQLVCKRCASTGWVCENHDDKPWDADELSCGCGGAGMPCQECNVAPDGVMPRGLPSETIMWTAADGWAS